MEEALRKARTALTKLIAEWDVSGFDGDQLHDAMVLLKDDLDPKEVHRVVQRWREQAHSHREAQAQGTGYPGTFFWLSRDFHDVDDAISRYLFQETFEVGEFPDVFDCVQDMVAQRLVEGIGGLDWQFGMPLHREVSEVSYYLWLVSRSRNLPNRIRAFVDIALARISRWQEVEGCWQDYEQVDPNTRKYIPTPNTCTTAKCSVALLKLATPDWLREKGKAGARWLLQHQNPDGSWSLQYTSAEGLKSRPDVFTTVLALESIIRGGMPGAAHLLETGFEWLIAQQGEDGLWEDGGVPFPLTTVMVLELARLWHAQPKKMEGRSLRLTKEFLDRSDRMFREENAYSYRLAVVTAHQAVESFLYEVLKRYNEKVYDKGETIGYRSALTKFQARLQAEGLIGKAEVVQYRNSLDELAYYRDQVVHKAIHVSERQCGTLVEDARRFVDLYSRLVFGRVPGFDY